MHTRLFTVPAFHAFGSDLGPFVLHTYGVLLAIGFLTGLFVAAWQARKAGLDAARSATWRSTCSSPVCWGRS